MTLEDIDDDTLYSVTLTDTLELAGQQIRPQETTAMVLKGDYLKTVLDKVDAESIVISTSIL